MSVNSLNRRHGMTGYLFKFIPRYASLTKPLRELTQKGAKFHWGREEDDALEELKGNISNKDTMAFFSPKLPIMVGVEASSMKDCQLAFFSNPPGAGNQCTPYAFHNGKEV